MLNTGPRLCTQCQLTKWDLNFSDMIRMTDKVWFLVIDILDSGYLGICGEYNGSG